MHMFDSYVAEYDPLELLAITNQDSSKSTVNIGVSANLGGHTRELCTGVSLAINKWIKEHGTYNIDILWEECALNEESTHQAAKNLVSRGADVVIGHLSATQALSCLDVYAKANLPFLAPGTSHPKLTKEGYQNVIRFCGLDNDLAQKMMNLANTEKSKNITLIYEEKTYGKMLSSLLIEYSNKIEGTNINQVITSNQLNEVIENDTILFSGRYEVAIDIIHHLSSLNFSGKLILGDDNYISDLLENVKEVERDMEIYVVSTPLETKSSQYKDFIKHYTNKANKPLGAYSITSYQATEYLLHSLNHLKSNGTDSCIQNIKKLAKKTSDSLIGEIDFTTNGDPLNFQWTEYQLDTGQFKKI
jgi:branched-chain amino acid transport system substrate-binding protein